MQPNTLLPAARRVPTLDGARSRGIYVEFYDPDGTRYGLPTYPYRWAPKNLLTVRQLRARGPAPRRAAAGRPDPVAARASASPTSTTLLSPCPSGPPPPPSSPPSARPCAPAHLPHLRHRKGLLHPALNRGMQRLRGPVITMTGQPAPNPVRPSTRALTPTTAAEGRRERRVRRVPPPRYPRLRTPHRGRRHRRPRRLAASWPTQLDTAISQAITGLRARGYSWADIGLPARRHPPGRPAALGR